MLIRSQDKKSLVNTDRIFSINFFELNGNFIIDATDSIGTEILATYSTEKKANDIVDRICSAYDDCLNGIAKADQKVWIRSIFDMPKDEDVIVEN